MNNPFFKNYDSCNQIDIYLGGTIKNAKVPNFCAFENIPSSFKLVGNSKAPEYINNWNQRYFTTFQCQSCYKYIAFGYENNGTTFNGYGADETKIIGYNYDFALNSVEFPFDEKIKEKFPEFYNIYMDTLKADKLELTEIVGMGYRKALENIVKQYLIDNPPIDDSSNNSFDPRNSSLYKCIEKLDPELIKTAHISRLVGNDETHFDSSKNSELTLKDQKKSLFIVVKRIEMKLQEAEFDDKYNQTQNN